jgi:ribosome-interacting GTPase 1
VDALARLPYSVPVSASAELNVDALLASLWQEMALVRVYTKKVGGKPDFEDPVVLSGDRGGVGVAALCAHVHRQMARELSHALVWGTSAKHYPQRCGLAHVLEDEDVVQLVKHKVMPTTGAGAVAGGLLGVGGDAGGRGAGGPAPDRIADREKKAPLRS